LRLDPAPLPGAQGAAPVCLLCNSTPFYASYAAVAGTMVEILLDSVPFRAEVTRLTADDDVGLTQCGAAYRLRRARTRHDDGDAVCGDEPQQIHAADEQSVACECVNDE